MKICNFRFIEQCRAPGSNSEGSDDRNIHGSALNRRIRRFEEEFGVEIFETLTARVRLEPCGASCWMQHFLMRNRICAG